jgi:ubiquinone/menaquinone biosynthesis C-methylase UbiE
MRTFHDRIHGAALFQRADRYDRMANHLGRALYERVAADVAAAGLGEAGRVLDVGTGPGRVPILVARTLPDCRVDGIDLSSPMIDRARRNAADAGLADRVTFIVGDVAALPYPDASFDLVVSTISQHHWADAQAGLREVRRVLRPGGQAWIYDFRLWYALGRAAAAARAVFPDRPVRSEPLRGGPLRLRLIGRVVAGPGPGEVAT